MVFLVIPSQRFSTALRRAPTSRLAVRMPDGDFFREGVPAIVHGFLEPSVSPHRSIGVSVVRLDDLQDARTEPLPRLRRRRGTAELRDTKRVAHVLLTRRRKCRGNRGFEASRPMQRLLVGSRNTTHRPIIPILETSSNRHPSCDAHHLAKAMKRAGGGGNRTREHGSPPRRRFRPHGEQNRHSDGQIDVSMSFCLNHFAAVNRAALCAARVSVDAAVGSSEGGKWGVSDPLCHPPFFAPGPVGGGRSRPRSQSLSSGRTALCP